MPPGIPHLFFFQVSFTKISYCAIFLLANKCVRVIIKCMQPRRGKMSKRTKGLFSFMVFFAWATCLSFCQRWLTYHYTGLDGLPSSNVFDIAQDAMGRVWFATRAGIACFDGVSWQNYTVSDGLFALSFMKIRVDENGRIWALPQAGKEGIQIVYHDGTRWNPIDLLPGTFSRLEKATSFLVIPAAQGKEANNLPIIVMGTMDAGLYRWEQGKWSSLTTGDGLPSNRVNGAVVLAGKLFVATDKGLSVIAWDRSKRIVDNRWNDFLGLPSREIRGICSEYKENYLNRTPGSPFASKTSRIWLYGHYWLASIDETVFANENRDPAQKAQYAQYAQYVKVYNPVETRLKAKDLQVELLPDSHGGLYAGNHFELFYFNYQTRRTELLNVDNGMVGSGVNGMFIDFEKNIWVACDRGVTKISGRQLTRQFTSFQMNQGLLEDEVSAVLEYGPGKFVLGHNTGFTFFDYGSRRFAKFPLPNMPGVNLLRRVLEMQRDGKGNIWAALGPAGLARIDAQRKIRLFTPSAGGPYNTTSLWVDAGDNLWLGSELGFFRKSGERFLPIALGPNPQPPIRKIFGTPGGDRRVRYLAGMGSGVYVYEDETKQWKNYQAPGDIRANSVYSIYKDNKNRLLIGTMTGLYTLEKGAIQKFEENGFELSRPVYFILEDREKRLWVGTDDGVVRWDGSRTQRYSISEGLIGQETNRGAGMLDSSGRLWIGTNRGLSIYEETPDYYSDGNPPPKLFLLDLEADGRKISLLQPVQLTDRTHDLVFHFRGISFLDEKAVRFKEKLEGFNDTWSEEHYPYKQMMRYTNLPPGRYRFHLAARNALGVWSDPVISPWIMIPSPFYRQWWFTLLGILAAVFVLYSIVRFISQKRNAALLEKLVIKRTGQLAASEKRYRTLFEESRDMIFTTANNGKFADINPAGVALLGYASKEEVLKIDIRSEFYYSDADRDAIYKEIKEKGDLRDFEMDVRRKDGEKVTVMITAAPVPGEDMTNDFLALRGTMRDITDKKRLQQQLEQAQKMEAIGTLAGGIAHDFNNILAVIIGYIELSLDEIPGDTPLRRHITRVRIAAERARELVNQILTFSRRSAKERKPLRIADIIKEALKLLRSSLPSTIEIRQDIAAASGIALANATQVQQVVMNLCTNAAHAMREKGGLLEVGLHEVYLDEISAAAYNGIGPGPYLKLSVGDTGHGIDPVIMKRIFEPYFTTKKHGEGTGMGLAVIHGIVKSHGGDVAVYSEPGRGTTFHVLLPAVEGTVETGTRETETPPGGKGQHILFVDDEKSLADVGEKLLKKLGYRVTAGSSSLEALELFRAGPGEFDLVITDLTMPNMTGVQLARELKHIRTGIPIILCTGYSEIITEDQILQLGIQKLLLKPVTILSLAKAIQEVLAT